MKRVGVLIVFVCLVGVSNFTSADTIRGIEMDFVTIGNAGNAGNPLSGGKNYGAVGYNYRIGKYEITNAQWNTFTAAAGEPNGDDTGYSLSAQFTGAQQPTNNISWYETLQFCNYLTSGDKSKGAYQFSGNNANPGSFLGIDRVSSISTYGTTYVIPTENEWYKAAYYKPDASGYSIYANGTDTAPSTSQACYSIYSSPWDVGTGTQEQNGTFDMMGDVMEWNETLFSGSYYLCHGGSYSFDVGSLRENVRYACYPYEENGVLGFRVTSVDVIPEPATLLLFGLGAVMLRRKTVLERKKYNDTIIVTGVETVS